LSFAPQAGDLRLCIYCRQAALPGASFCRECRVGIIALIDAIRNGRDRGNCLKCGLPTPIIPQVVAHFGIYERAFMCESCWLRYDEIAKQLAAQNAPDFHTAARLEFAPEYACAN
jgi:hypothetical protein